MSTPTMSTPTMSDQNLSESEMDKTEQFQIKHNYDTARLQKLHTLHRRQYRFMPKYQSRDSPAVDDDNDGEIDHNAGILEQFPGFDAFSELLIDAKEMYLEVTDPFQTIPPISSNSPNSVLKLGTSPHKNDRSDHNSQNSQNTPLIHLPTQLSTHLPTQDEYDRNFIALLENEKTLADILISTQNLLNIFSTLTSYLDLMDDEDEMMSFLESNGYKAINQIGILALTHNQILHQIVDTYGIDTLYLREAVYSLAHPNAAMNQYPTECTQLIPQLASAVPNLAHFNPYSSNRSLAEQVDIFQKRFPSIHTIGVGSFQDLGLDQSTNFGSAEDKTDTRSTTTTPTLLSLPTSQLSFQTVQREMAIMAPDPLPPHHRLKALRFAEKIAFENSHGYGFSNSINYLGYLNYSMNDPRTIETGDSIEIWKPADFDSATAINQFYSDLPINTQQQSQSKPIAVPHNLITYSLFPRTVPLLAHSHHDPLTKKIPLCDLPCSIFFLLTMYNSIMAQVWYIQIMLLATLDQDWKGYDRLFANGLGELFGTYLPLQNLPSGLYEQIISTLSLFINRNPQRLRQITSFVPIPTLVKNNLKQFIKFPFCLEAPRLSLLQGPGAFGLFSLCRFITRLLSTAKDDTGKLTPIFSRQELQDLVLVGKVALTCVLYTDWFETTIRDEKEGKNFEIITLDQFGLDVDFDYYHNFFGGEVEQCHDGTSGAIGRNSGDNRYPQPFSRLGTVSGKPLVVDVKNPKIDTKVDEVINILPFLTETTRLVKSLQENWNDDANNTKSEQQSIFTPDLINLTISTVIKNSYSPYRLVAGLAPRMCPPESFTESTFITPLTHLAEYLMSHSQYGNLLNQIFHFLVQRLLVDVKEQNHLHFWAVSKNVDLIQSTLAQLYQIVSASCSGYTPAFVLSPKNGTFKPQYQSQLVPSIHPLTFSPPPREILGFLQDGPSRLDETSDSDDDEELSPFDESTNLAGSMRGILRSQLMDDLSGLPTVLDETCSSFSNHNPLLVPFITTHHGVANTISQLSTLLKPDPQSMILDSVVAIGLEFQILLASFARQFPTAVTVDSTIDNRSNGDSSSEMSDHIITIKNNESDGRFKSHSEMRSLLLEFRSGIPRRSIDLCNKPHTGKYQSATDLIKLVPIHFCTIPDFNPHQSLFRSTYILYIEILIRAIQGISFSWFHMSQLNDKWGSSATKLSDPPIYHLDWVGKTDLTIKPRHIEQLYNIPPGERDHDAYLEHVRKLANPNFINDRESILSYPHTTPFLNEPIPPARCRSVAQIQHCIESFIDLLIVPSAWKITQSINFDLPNDKIGVYREDFLLLPEHDAAAQFFKTFSLGHGLNDVDMDDIEKEKDLSNLDLNPVFERLQFYNLGHLVKAIPFHIWDYIYRQDYKSIGEDGGYISDDPQCPYRSYASYISSTRAKRLNILKDKYPLRYQPRPTIFPEMIQSKTQGSTEMNDDDNLDQNRDMNDLADSTTTLQPSQFDSFCGYTYYQHIAPATPKQPFTPQRYPIVYAEKEHQDELRQWYANSDIGKQSDDQFCLPESCCTSGNCTCHSGDNKNQDPKSQRPSMGYGPILPTHNHLPFFYTSQTNDELDLVFSAYSKENLFALGDNANDYHAYQDKLNSTPRPIVPTQSAEPETVPPSYTTSQHPQSQPPSPFHTPFSAIGKLDTIGYTDSCIDMNMLSYNINQQLLLCLGSTQSSPKWRQSVVAVVENNSCGDDKENSTPAHAITPINHHYLDQSTYSLINEFTTLAAKCSTDASRCFDSDYCDKWWGNPTRLDAIVGEMVNDEFVNNLMTNPINIHPNDRIPLSGRVVNIDQGDRELLERFYNARDGSIVEKKTATDNQLDTTSQALTVRPPTTTTTALQQTTPISTLINPSPQLQVSHLYQSTTYQLPPVSISPPTSVILDIFTMTTLALGRKRNTGFHFSLFGHCPDPKQTYVLRHPSLSPSTLSQSNNKDNMDDEYTWVLDQGGDDDDDDEHTQSGDRYHWVSDGSYTQSSDEGGDEDEDEQDD